VIPGEVRMTLDLRHLEGDRLEGMIAEVRSVIEQTCERHGLTYELVPTADFPALYFDDVCVSAVRESAQALGLPHMDIVSGAGHDAIFLAELGPAGMVFVPCENGISHNEIENATPEDLAAGCAVLLRAMLAASEAVAKGRLAA
jgi:beta-ureidopropionase / N-carbamoyl-L-amino-acid hydrolase